MTMETEPRWRKALTRKRARPAIAYARSTSPSVANSSSLAESAPSMWRTASLVSCCSSGSAPGMGRSSPSMRHSGCDGTFRWRSEPRFSMRYCRQWWRSKDTSQGIGHWSRRLKRPLDEWTYLRIGRPSRKQRRPRTRRGLRKHGSARFRPSLGHVAQLLRLGERLKLLERLVLDLADALARHVERAAHLVEGPGVLAAQPVAELEHAALAVGEVLQRLAQRLLRQDLRGALVRRLGPLVGDELAELGLLLVADRLLERDRGLRGALDRVDLLRVDPGDLGDLVGGRLAPQLGDQLALGAADLVELLDHVHGYPDRARLVGQGAGDRLADPPGRVRGELEALAVVELLRRAHEPERPLLDQVEEREPLVAVVLGDRDHQAQVGLDHLLLGVEVAAFDAAGEVDLFLGGEQPNLADVLQEQLKGVGGHVGLQIERRLRLAPAPLVGRAVLLRGLDRRIDFLDELDLRPLQVGVQLLDVGLVEVDLRHGGRDLGEGEDADLLPLEKEALDFLEFCEIHY